MAVGQCCYEVTLLTSLSANALSRLPVLGTDTRDQSTPDYPGWMGVEFSEIIGNPG